MSTHIQESTGGYKDLRVYRLADELGLKSHALSLKLPRFEMFEEASQLRRCSKRVSASIVEGYAHRKYRDEFIRYLYRALGSSDESNEHLQVIHETGSARNCPEVTDLIKSYESLSRPLAKFISGVERFHTTPSHIHNPSSAIHNRR